MSSVVTEEISRFDALIEKFEKIKRKYGDNYPIIFYEPSINCQEKKVLKDLIQGNNSINFFDNFKEAFKFVQSLGISFILIVSKYFEEQIVLKNFENLENIHGRAMFEFEEEALLKDLFNGISADLVKSLKIKAYVFVTSLDFMTEASVKETEEEVLMMCDLKDMVKEFRQDFLVMWYDPKINSGSKSKLEKDIEINIDDKNIFLDFAELHKKIGNYTGIPYHLIFSGRDEAEKLIKEIDNLKGLLGLYIYDDNAQEIADDRVEIQKTLEELIPKIKEGFRRKSKLINTFPSFATNFDAMDKSHIYNVHYYLKGLINFYNREQAKGDFVKLAQKIYQDQAGLLVKFKNGYDKYHCENILYWYTRDSPVYKLLNNCLRLASSDSILYSRFILRDMEQAIKEQYQQFCKDFNGLVYRGAYISTEEWEKLERNIGQEIEMYGFLSTSANKRVAVKFFQGDMKNKIFITIIVPSLPGLDEQGFADISQFSDFPGEKEMLFNIRSRFKILEAKISQIERGVTGRHLVLLYGAQSLRKYMAKHQPVIQIELQLSPVKKCGLCESNSQLFALNQKEATEIRCIDCLIKNTIPKDTPLFALDLEKNEGETVVKRLKGQILGFNKAFDFSDSGYKCQNCNKSGKQHYYKWLNKEREEQFVQCSDCFKNKKETGCQILLAESSPYVFWQESQTVWETVDTDYQAEVSEIAKYKDQGEVFEEAQRFDSCIEFEKRVLNQSKRRRVREKTKLKSLLTIGRASEQCGNHQEALRYHQEVLKMTEILLGEEHPWTASSIDNVASVYQSLGEYAKALECHKKSLDMTRRIYGEQHLQTAISYHNLASAFFYAGQNPEALENGTKALDITKTLFGENHPKTADSYNNMAEIFKNVGQYQKAIEFHKKALDIKRAVYGDKHRATAESFNNLASVSESFGEHKSALEYHTQALNTWKAIYGENSQAVATSYHNLALVYESMGEYQQAFEHHNKALNLKKGISGDKHPDVASSLNNLGLLYQKLGQHQNALNYFAKSLDIMKIVYGDSHPQTANVFNNIALVYKDQGQYQEALEYHEKALDIRKTKCGDKHPDTATSHNNLGAVYQKFGQYQQAFEHNERALSIWKAVYGAKKHIDLATSENNLGSVCLDMGKHQEAISHLTKALEITEGLDGEKESLRASSCSCLASVYQHLGQYIRAIEYYSLSLKSIIAIYGEKHIDAAIVYNNLGSVYLNLQQYQEALPYLRKALKITEAIYGEKHPETVAFESNLASLYFNLGKHRQAIKHFLKALDIVKAVYGEKHPQTATLYNNLGSVYRGLGRHQEALPYLKKALEIAQIVYEENHSETATFQSNLGSAYLSLGQGQQALELFIKALQIAKIVYGENHPQTAIFYSNLAETYEVAGQHQNAQEYRRRVSEVSRIIPQPSVSSHDLA